GVRTCSLRSAGSAGSIAPSTSTRARARGAGRHATPRLDLSRIALPRRRLPEQTDHAADDADQADVARDDRLVGRVLGDQLHVAVTPLEALHGRVAVDQGDHDGAVARLLLRPHEDHVAVEDARVDHAVAAHLEQEVAVLGELGREEEVVFDVLLRQDRRTGGHVADDGHRDGVAALVVDLGVAHELDGAGLGRIALDQAAALELVEVVVDGRAGAQADGLADLTDARGVVPDLGDVADVVEDLCLPVGELIGQFEFISAFLWIAPGGVSGIVAGRRGLCKPLFDALTAERPFPMLSNVCTPPAPQSAPHRGRLPRPRSDTSAVGCWPGCWWCWRAGCWRGWRLAERRPSTRPWWCSRGTRCGRSPRRTTRLPIRGSGWRRSRS